MFKSSLTENAKNYLSTTTKAHDKKYAYLAVNGGGCSGFEYGFTFDEDVEEDDTLIESDGATLIVDALSFQYLVGAEVDFKEDLSGARFVVTNPNASTTCGCGNSFSL